MRHQLIGAQDQERRTGCALKGDRGLGSAELEDPVEAAAAGGKPVALSDNKDRDCRAFSGGGHGGQCVYLSMDVMGAKDVLDVAADMDSALCRKSGGAHTRLAMDARVLAHCPSGVSQAGPRLRTRVAHRTQQCRWRRRNTSITVICSRMQRGRVSTGRVAILTILDEEFDAVTRQIGPVCEIEDAYWRPVADERHDVVLMQSADRSNVAAQEAVQDLIEAFRPEVLIVCGIGGGVEGKDDIATGDVVVASYLHYSEFRKMSEHGDHDRYMAYDQPSANLRWKHAQPVRRSDWASRIDVPRPEGDGEPKALVGPVLAGEKVMETPIIMSISARLRASTTQSLSTWSPTGSAAPSTAPVARLTTTLF